jgi:SOS response regulatory protein OraA/RecX
MARIVAYEEGALGTVKAVSEDGSLFLFKTCYLEDSFAAADLADESISFPHQLPFDIPDDVLTMALQATLAEARALSLLARAEQYRAGLERKLRAKDGSPFACRVALDKLEAEGLLSDERYAESWMRQRLRSRAEGPRSLSAALGSRGVDRKAVKEAMAHSFEGEEHRDERLALIASAALRLLSRTPDRRTVRMALLELGWRPGDVDEALDSLEA